MPWLHLDSKCHTMIPNQSSPSLNTSVRVASQSQTPKENDCHSISDFNEIEIDDDLIYLKHEQSKIDSTLNFLLNFECQKRKPGRPRADSDTNNTTLKVPDTVADNLKDFTNINRLHPGVLLDYLRKVNDFNKKILHNYELLNNKYNDLSSKIENLATVNVNRVQSTEGETASHPVTSSPVPHLSAVPKIKPNFNDLNDERSKSDLELKIDQIEQRTYANILICNGKFVCDALKNESQNIKQTIITKISEYLPDLTNNDINKVIVFGKNKSTLKLECASSIVKGRILYEIRKVKPDDIFFSEYLTSFRSKLYYELRQLRNKNQDKIVTYIRNGNLFFKLKSDNNNRFGAINNYNDLNLLKVRLQSPREFVNDSENVS